MGSDDLEESGTSSFIYRKLSLLHLSGSEEVLADYQLYFKDEDYRQHLLLVSGHLARLRALRIERQVVHYEMKLAEGVNEPEHERLSCRYKQQPELVTGEMEATVRRVILGWLQRQIQDQAK
ncbi:hypothetical protein RUND412_001416 [Rhizina undulata]